ncbi:hypothetical protein DID88_003169 [Monilinia fructigena]|uniref:Amino acid transporter transmembrane domain-containing protein n=1 Tax=Monilinia fructigena TaxID=38457 RepID=A0A395IV11_9HELO|nr:hypothetical protein DID88_003169 [Monilinia fructigena]
MATTAELAGSAGDPQARTENVNPSTYVQPQHKKLHDPSVTFEEYRYYADLARAEEHASTNHDIGDTTFFSLIVPPKNSKGQAPVNSTIVEKSTGEKGVNGDTREETTVAERDVHGMAHGDRATVTNDEWTNASRALRTATWSAVFYLITTDILGPFGVPFALGTLGWGPGIALYTALSQVLKFKLCYAICCLVFALAGFFLGQVRTLQKFGWLANAAIWMNVFIIFCTMGVVAHSAHQNYLAVDAAAGTALGDALVTPDDAGNFLPVTTFGHLPPSTAGFTGAVNGLMQAVYAYGGAMLFTEFMSEMRKPRDFWKGMICAQAFIYILYIFYGYFIYGYQGQYAVNPSYQGVSPYAWQTINNIIAFISALIAAGLYGNIGIKSLIQQYIHEFLWCSTS